MTSFIGLVSALAFVALVIHMARRGSMTGPVDGKRSEDWYVEPKVRHRLSLQKDREEA